MKRIAELIDMWGEEASEPRTEHAYQVQLPVHDAAKIAALAEMYPGRTQEQIITDLLGAALDDLEAGFGYRAGNRVVEEDENGDPIYEDVGLTPRFKSLARKHLERFQGE